MAQGGLNRMPCEEIVKFFKGEKEEVKMEIIGKE